MLHPDQGYVIIIRFTFNKCIKNTRVQDNKSDIEMEMDHILIFILCNGTLISSNSITTENERKSANNRILNENTTTFLASSNIRGGVGNGNVIKVMKNTLRFMQYGSS